MHMLNYNFTYEDFIFSIILSTIIKICFRDNYIYLYRDLTHSFWGSFSVKFCGHITSSICPLLKETLRLFHVAVVDVDITHKAAMTVFGQRSPWVFASISIKISFSNDFRSIPSLDILLWSFILRKVPKRFLVNKYLLNRIIYINWFHRDSYSGNFISWIWICMFKSLLYSEHVGYKFVFW